ncbi:hypothetical protein L218DRAFT_951290 [Marasmius fiardii PR-910]|nr:hypothetical protein L218DRAFT_951290 [Marasmius fiardii PR-910]
MSYFSHPEPRKRTLRLSMIQSAEVFTPRPSADPMENLRVLQSPLRSYRSPSKTPSPSPVIGRSLFGNGTLTTPSPHSDLGAVTLVDGNNPRVVEEDQDLVILEDVVVPPTIPSNSTLPASPAKAGYKPAPPPVLSLQVPPAPPVTPRRSRPTLHQAVLIRSAQRAAIKAEIQREEEEQEEMEVFGTIFAEEDEGDEDDVPMPVDATEDASSDEDIFNEEENSNTKESWRQSIGRIWPFSSRSPSPTKNSPPKSPEAEIEEPPLSDPVVESDEIKEEMEETVEPLFAIPGTPIRKSLANSSSSIKPPLRGLFMTPQPTSSSNSLFARGRQRMSLGGQAMRVKVEERPWKVEDIVLPIPPPPPSTKDQENVLPSQPSPAPGARPSLSEAERAAIRERRRSALKMPETFFGGSGGVPGISSSPIKREGPFSSPFKGRRGFSFEDETEESKERVKEDDEDVDARTLLERMRGAVEDMRSRRASMSVSPIKGGTLQKVEEEDDNEEDRPAKEFSLLRTPDVGRVGRKSVYVVEPASRCGIVAMEVDGSVSLAIGSNVDKDGLDTREGLPDVEMAVADVVPPSPVLSPVKTRNGRRHGLVAKSKTGTVSIDTPSLADDEASPGVGEGGEGEESSDEEPAKAKTGRIMRGRGRGEGQQAKPPSKTRGRGGSSTAKPVTVDETMSTERAAPAPEEVGDDSEPLPVKKTTATRTKVSPPPLPTRSTRRARTVEPHRSQQSEDEGGEFSTTTTTGKKPQSRRAAVSTRAAQKTRTTRAAAAALATATSESETESTCRKSGSKRGVGRRGKPTAPETIKEEEENGSPPKVVGQKKKKTGGRSRKMGTEADNLPIAPLKSKSRSTTTTKAAVVETAELEEVPVNDKEKENSDNEIVVVKTRAGGRSRKGVNKVKEEAVTEPELGTTTTTRTTRGMRTRSRT